jgi:DNA-binding response OmpR family regulator
MPMANNAVRAVLVVDDDEDINDVVSLALADQGLEVQSARNGREAFDLLKLGSFQPGLILLDLMMPEMNGTEFLSLLRAESRFDAVRVIVMSAHAAVSAQIEGAQALLRKPFDLTQLLDLVDLHLPPFAPPSQ